MSTPDGSGNRMTPRRSREPLSRGKARLHKRANAAEQAACRPWLAAKLARVRHRHAGPGDLAYVRDPAHAPAAARHGADATRGRPGARRNGSHAA